MSSEVVCPVSIEKVDENVVRIISLVMVTFLIPAIFIKSYLVVLLIGADFGLRAFTSGKYSLLKLIAKSIAGYLRLEKKPIDAAPKKFAAGLGMVFSLAIAIALYLGDYVLSDIFGVLLTGCAILEGVFAFCVGCHIYSWIIIPFNRLVYGIEHK